MSYIKDIMVFYTFNFGFTMHPCRNQEREGGGGWGTAATPPDFC